MVETGVTDADLTLFQGNAASDGSTPAQQNLWRGDSLLGFLRPVPAVEGCGGGCGGGSESENLSQSTSRCGAGRTGVCVCVCLCVCVCRVSHSGKVRGLFRLRVKSKHKISAE